MRFFYLFLFILIVTALPVRSQILNGGFEQWSGNEPAHWNTNNVIDPPPPIPTVITISPTTDAHRGDLALKGETIEVNGIPQSPYLEGAFSFSSQPDSIRGYFKFFPVGGDKLDITFQLYKGEQLVGLAGGTELATPDTGYTELVYQVNYQDTVTVPDRISAVFLIIPEGGIDPENHPNVGTTFYIDDFPAMRMTRPPEEPENSATLGKVSEDERLVFISGEKEDIKWDAGGVQNVDIEYSEDDGKTYTNIVRNHKADKGKYRWDVPDFLLTRKGKIRVKDSHTPGNIIKSIQFTIKPWQFSRINADGELELFDPILDGWNFSSLPEKMWPPSWYQQFDYQFGDDPYTDAAYPVRTPFVSAQSSDFVDWPLFVDVFGTDQCYYPLLLGYKSAATAKWNVIKKNWNGSCYGFAISSLLAFYHKSALLNQFPGIGDFQRLGSVSVGDTSRLAINHYFTHQFGEAAQQNDRANRSTPARQLLKQLKDMLKRENGDGRALSFYNNMGSGGHTVVPYKLERIGQAPADVFRVRVYDSNKPGSATENIQIDSSQSNWTDNTVLGWGTGVRGCFLELLSGSYLLTPSLRKQSSELLAFNPISTESEKTTTLYNPIDASIIINDHEKQIGYQDSVVINDFQDARPIIPKTGSFHPPIGYELPAGSYSMQLSDYTDSSSYVYVFEDSLIYNYRRSDADFSQTDELHYDERGFAINNQDEVNKTIHLETVLYEKNVSERVFTASNLQISAGDSLRISEKDRHDLLLHNYGENTTYDLKMRTVSSSGESFFMNKSIPLNQNTGHQIIPAWDDLDGGPVTILVDNGNDGSTDDSLEIENQFTGFDRSQGNLHTPEQYRLEQNYPNPFNNTTRISYTISEKRQITLKVYNLLGEEQATLVNEVKEAGRYEVLFETENLASGIYLYRIQAGEFNKTRKMIYIK